MVNKLPESSYLTIQAFMINELNLKGNELLTYALIYGFSQDRESQFKGSLNYIQAWLNAGSKHTAIKAINNLEEKKLIIKKQKEINNVKFNRYEINHSIIENLKSVKKLGSAESALPHNFSTFSNNAQVVQKMHYPCNQDIGSAESALGGCRKCTEGSAESAPNNIINNINNNNNTNPNSKTKLKGMPTLEEIISYSKGFGENLFLNPEDFFEYNQQRNWQDDKKSPIKNWKALFNNWNNKEKLSHDRFELDKKIKEEKQKMVKSKQEAIVANNVQLKCPECSSTFPPLESTYNKNTGIATCSNCNLSFKVA